MISKVKEKEFMHEILEYINLAIDDPDTDGDRLIGYLVGILVKTGKINNKRSNTYYKEARSILKDL